MFKLLLYYVLLYYIILLCIMLYYTTFYNIILYYIMLYYNMLYHIIFSSIFYYIMLYYIVLYFIIVYYIMLYCIILYHIILYYIVLYYIIYTMDIHGIPMTSPRCCPLATRHHYSSAIQQPIRRCCWRAYWAPSPHWPPASFCWPCWTFCPSEMMGDGRWNPEGARREMIFLS